MCQQEVYLLLGTQCSFSVKNNTCTLETIFLQQCAENSLLTIEEFLAPSVTIQDCFFLTMSFAKKKKNVAFKI